MESRAFMSQTTRDTTTMVSNAGSPLEQSQSASLVIEQLQQKLRQAQRLAAVGELTSTTTHEFNNLLMTIMNYAKMGLRHKDEPTRDKALSKILDAANRAAKVTQTILGLARNRSGQREPTDLASVIRDTLVLLEREMARYRIVVELDLDNVPLAIAEGNQIQRVLINLLTNARQAIGESGTIRIRLSFDPDQQQVILMVRDSGAGIAPEQLPRIFEPFFSTKAGPDASGKGGTGLGLSACREIIEEHHGKIRVESSLGKGTAFHIRLPADPTSLRRLSA
jgi:two-component system, NtrC family, sensor kinase